MGQQRPHGRRVKPPAERVRLAQRWCPSRTRRGPLHQGLESSLKALKTDYIDLYQFHSGTNEVFDNPDLWAMLEKQVRCGKVRFLGISLAASLLQKGDLHQIHGAAEVKASVIQVVYNRLHKEAEQQVLPFCQEHHLGVLARVPLAKGFLCGNYKPGAVFAPNDTRSLYGTTFNDEQLKQVEQIKQQEVPPGQNMAQWALAWSLRHPSVSAVIVGCKTVGQVELNAAAAELAGVQGREALTDAGEQKS
jgi:aryl-alcohol dehydrogenase-like predicted oxidoreductase